MSLSSGIRQGLARIDKAASCSLQLVRSMVWLFPGRHTPDYDKLSCAAQWAKDTLEVHKKDKREYLYTK